MVEVGDGGFATEFEQLSYLVYADRPEHIRAAGGPWAGVARVVDHASAVLEDGRAKLTEVWRSPAGELYTAKMGEVAQAMREVSVVARHNGQVMEAAAEALDAKQKDFGVLSTAPIPSDALERFARAIVKSLDESYQQAVADFRPVPPTPEPVIDPLGPVEAGDLASRRNPASGCGSAVGGGAVSSGTTPDATHPSPSWVPVQPTTARPDTYGSTTADGSGPQLQSITSGSAHGGGHWDASSGLAGRAMGSAPGGFPTPTPGTTVPPDGASVPFGASRVGGGPVGVPPRSAGTGLPAGQQPWPPGRPRTPAALHPGEGSIRPASASQSGSASRTGVNQPGTMLGGVPAGAVGASGPSGWPGYRRRAEPFPTSQQTTVAPVIDAVPAEEPELVNTDYADDYGNRITIRRPA